MKRQQKHGMTLLMVMLSVLTLVCSSCSGKQLVLKDGEITMLSDNVYSVPASQLMQLMECCELCIEEK